MYAHSYKLNNSYTVYYVPSWYDETKSANYRNNNTRYEKKSTDNKEALVGAKVEHKYFGKGKIKLISSDGKMIINYSKYQVECTYPSAFDGGFVRLAARG